MIHDDCENLSWLAVVFVAIQSFLIYFAVTQPKPKYEYTPGDKVRVVSGYYKDRIGVVDSADKGIFDCRALVFVVINPKEKEFFNVCNLEFLK